MGRRHTARTAGWHRVPGGVWCTILDLASSMAFLWPMSHRIGWWGWRQKAIIWESCWQVIRFGTRLDGRTGKFGANCVCLFYVQPHIRDREWLAFWSFQNLDCFFSSFSWREKKKIKNQIKESLYSRSEINPFLSNCFPPPTQFFFFFFGPPFTRGKKGKKEGKYSEGKER